MASVTIQLRPETEQKLRQRAGRRGASLESYLQELAEREAAADGTGVPAEQRLPSFEEMTAPLAEGARPIHQARSLSPFAFDRVQLRHALPQDLAVRGRHLDVAEAGARFPGADPNRATQMILIGKVEKEFLVEKIGRA